MKKFNFLLPILCAVLFTGCDPNDNDSNPSDTEFAENFGNSVSRDFIGRVVDTGNQPVQNATVKIGSSTVMTDVNGIFIINNADAYEKFAYITVKKAGYLDGSRSLVPTTGKNSVKIMLLPATPIQTISSDTTSEVTLDNGTKVTFDGAFQDESGNAYSGDVNVAMFHLESSDPNVNSLMPGMLYGKADDGNGKVMETFGMLNVELKGTGGQKLQIREGHKAQIKIAIDNSQLATAPATIPLWHFDEANGYWKQDGYSTRQGNFYVAEVSHFSWWNWDACFPTVNLSVRLVDTNGNPLAYVGVEMVRSDGSTTYGWTDDNGNVSGLVPSNETLTLKVINESCSTTAYTTSVGPFTSDATLPDIVVDLSSQTALITGTLLTCNNLPVTNGYVTFGSGTGYQFGISQVNSNGNFSFSTLVCSGTNQNVMVTGYDFENLQTTDSISYSVVTPITNIGNIAACNAVEGFISYKIDNNPTVMIFGYTNGSIDGGSLFLYASNPDQTSLSIAGDMLVPGDYTTANFSIDSNLLMINSTMSNNVHFYLSSVGAVGDYIDMTFNGTYTDDTGTHIIDGVVHVKRTF